MITIDIFKYETLAALEADQQQDRAERIAALEKDWRDNKDPARWPRYPVILNPWDKPNFITAMNERRDAEIKSLGSTLDAAYAVQREQLAILLEREAVSGQRWR